METHPLHPDTPRYWMHILRRPADLERFLLYDGAVFFSIGAGRLTAPINADEPFGEPDDIVLITRCDVRHGCLTRFYEDGITTPEDTVCLDRLGLEDLTAPEGFPKIPGVEPLSLDQALSALRSDKALLRQGIAERLRVARETRRMNQAELARAAGLPSALISHFECGRRVPSILNLARLADALCTSTDFLCGRNPHPGTSTIVASELIGLVERLPRRDVDTILALARHLATSRLPSTPSTET